MDTFAACAAESLPDNAVFETPVSRADLLLVLGNKEKGASRLLAMRAAALYRAGHAPRIIASGGVTDDDGHREARHIRTYLLAMGVPAKNITCEDKSTNTRENISFSRSIAMRMRDLPRHPRVIVLGQRFASRRIAMTLAAQWPEATGMITSVCMFEKPVHLWHLHSKALHCTAREIQKMPEYMAKGDIAAIVPDTIHRHLRALKARDSAPRPCRP